MKKYGITPQHASDKCRYFAKRIDMTWSYDVLSKDIILQRVIITCAAIPSFLLRRLQSLRDVSIDKSEHKQALFYSSAASNVCSCAWHIYAFVQLLNVHCSYILFYTCMQLKVSRTATRGGFRLRKKAYTRLGHSVNRNTELQNKMHFSILG